MEEHAVFIGEREHSLDKKNRAIVPSIFREIVHPKRDGLEFFLSPGLDACLYLYTQARWDELASRIRKMNFGDKSARAFQRKFFGNAERCKPDSAGRILIPERLKTMAGLEKDLVFLGVGDKIEIWAKEKWTQQEGEEVPLEDLAQKLFGPDESDL